MRKFCISIGLLILGVATGCGTLSNGRGWGQDATLNPGWTRIRNTAVDAVVSPEFWFPLAAALALQVDDWDEDLADWGSENTPVFGSPERAEDAGDLLANTAHATYFITALATPSGEDRSDWTKNKLKGLAVGLGAMSLNRVSTELLKDAMDRERPDDSDHESFPSGHTSAAATSATLASRNLESLSLSRGQRLAFRTAFVTLPFATGWARVEANRHFPSDVLVGAALGHFFGALINDAYLGFDAATEVRVTVNFGKEGGKVGLTWAF
jgi:hypothetical protein